MTLLNKRTAFTLCVALMVYFFVQCVSTASNTSQDILASLIKSGGCLDSLVFLNQVVQPDVKINGTGVMKSKDGSCIVGTSLVLPPYFCSLATNVTLYHGDPPSPQNFTGLELCTRFLHVSPSHESEENGCVNVIVGLTIALVVAVALLLGIALACVILYWRKRCTGRRMQLSDTESKTQNPGEGATASEEPDLLFSIPDRNDNGTEDQPYEPNQDSNQALTSRQRLNRYQHHSTQRVTETDTTDIGVDTEHSDYIPLAEIPTVAEEDVMNPGTEATSWGPSEQV